MGVNSPYWHSWGGYDGGGCKDKFGVKWTVHWSDPKQGK